MDRRKFLAGTAATGIAASTSLVASPRRFPMKDSKVEKDKTIYFGKFKLETFMLMSKMASPTGKLEGEISAVLGIDIWVDILADEKFSSFSSPTTKHETLKGGYLGKTLGVHLFTDSFWENHERFLDQGEVLVFPATHQEASLFLSLSSKHQSPVTPGRDIYFSGGPTLIKGQRIKV